MLLEKLPFFILSAVISVVTILMQAEINAFSLAVPLADRLGYAVVSQDAGHDNAYHSFRATIDWMYTPIAGQIGANAYLNHPRVALFNNSWGAFVEEDDNGANRFARFVPPSNPISMTALSQFTFPTSQTCGPTVLAALAILTTALLARLPRRPLHAVRRCRHNLPRS